MITLFLKKLGIGLVMNVILVILVSIIFLIISGLLITFTGLNAIGTYILAAILSLAGAIFLCIIYYEFLSEKFGSYGKFFVNRVKRNKQLKVFWALLLLVPFFSISIICVIFMIHYCDFLNANILQAVKVSPDSATQFILIAAILSTSAVVWIVYSIVVLIEMLANTCSKCLCIFSFVETGLLDFLTSERDEYKTRSYRSNVGSVYVNNQKIGDVYKDGTETYSRKLTTHVGTYSYQCSRCGKSKKVSKLISYHYTDWE